jgi:diguanylate cyclase (GGDEF)-like protein/PAS domain S-box-containing protein
VSKTTAAPNILERTTNLSMAFVFIISLLAGIGWVVNKPILASLNPTYIPMSPVSVLILLGLWVTWLLQFLFSTRHRTRSIQQVLLFGLLIIVIILALRTLTGLGPNLEKWLLPTPPLFGKVPSGRMSPLAAFGFLLMIPAFLLLTVREPNQRTKSAAAGLALVAFTLSGVILLGYLFGAPLFYGGTIIPVAATTALSFLFFSLGLMMMAGPACWPLRMYVGYSLSARLMRAFIPASILIALLQGLLSTDANKWIINPALKVAVAALLACLIFLLIVSLFAKNLSAGIERGTRAEAALQQSETQLRALFASMHDVVIVYDIDGRYIEIAPTDPASLYRPPDEMLGKTVYDILPKEQAEYIVSSIRESIQTNHVVQGEYKLNIDGEDVWFSSSASRLSETTAFWVAHNNTERRRLELVQNAIFRITQASITGKGVDELYQSIHAILGELVPAQNFYISLFDQVKGEISFPYYVDQFDEPPPAPTPLQGLTGYVIRTSKPLLAHPDIFDRLVQQGEIEVVGTTGEDWMGAPLIVEGRIIGVMAIQSYTKGIQADLNLLEFVSTQVAQVIERKRMEKEIASLSVTDELTGLYNRRGFNLLADQEMKLARRFKRSVLLYFCDVDNLKTINDTLGHAQGDLALKEMGSILKEAFREADITARFGGDEFVVLAPDASLETGKLLTTRIQSILEKRNRMGERPFQLTFTMGIAHFDPESPSTINELIAQADEQMYHNKKAKM